MQSQIYFAHWVIFWSKCDGLWLGQTNICVVYWLHLYVYLKKSKYLLFLCRRITSVHCWWPVVVNGAVFMRKKVDSLVMWWRSSLVNSINVSQFPGWLLHFVVYWSETVPHCVCAITCHRNFSQTEDHSAKEARSKKRYVQLYWSIVSTRTPLTI